MGALLHNAFQAGDKPLPKAKLPPAFLDHPTKFPIDSCVRDYRDWTTGQGDKPSPEEHIVWLSSVFTPFQTDPGTPFVPLDFTLGLPAVEDWPKWTGDIPWVLDPAEHPKPAVPSHHESANPSSGDKRQRRWRKKKKHRRPKKQELNVTTRGKGEDVPIWTNTGSNLSSSSELQTEGDSGVGSYRRPRHNHTPCYSPETVRKQDEGDLEDAPLSDHGGNSDGDQEMVSGDDRAKEAMGTDPVRPAGPMATVTSPAINLVVAPEALEGSEVPLLGDPADMEDEKACRGAFQLIMEGFHTATRTLSGRYQEACKEVQTIVWRSLRKSTAMDRTFVWGSSAAIRQWVRAVELAMDCIGKSLEEQSRLLQVARQARKEATEDILVLLPLEKSPYLTPVVLREDILTPALQATRNHTERAIKAVNVQMSTLVHRHIPPQQAGVFLTTLLQVMCSYRQEMDNMATSQVILRSQIVPNLWGVSQTMMEGLTLLGPPNCPASWPASLVKQVSAEPVNKATPIGLTTLVKCDTSIPSKGKLHLGSSGKKSVPPKRITDYWDDDERKREDEESLQ